MSEEELEKALDEIFKEDIEMIRERMKVLIRGYDKALTKLVEKDKVIDLMTELLCSIDVKSELGEESWNWNKEQMKEYFLKKVEGKDD